MIDTVGESYEYPPYVGNIGRNVVFRAGVEVFLRRSNWRAHSYEG